MKIKYFFLAIGLLLIMAFIIGGSIFIPIGSAYNAKTLCSCVFVAGRQAQDVEQNELAANGYLQNELDREKRTVSSSLWGLWKRTAVFREGMGCSLAQNGIAAIQELAKRSQIRTVPTAPSWPKTYDPRDSIQIPVNWARLEKGIDYAFEEKAGSAQKNTRGLVILYDTLLIAERYGEGYGPESALIGWSMTKSITQALIGILVGEGKLQLAEAPPIPEWQEAADSRQKISLDHLLRMSSGLAFEEVYFPPADATTMLFQEADMGAYAASKPLAHEPDSLWSYSSGTTNLLSRLIRHTVGEVAYPSFPWTALFDKIGMHSAVLETDASGTFVGSSFMYANSRDWAKFGLLYLKDGVWQGKRILPEGWVDYTRTPTPKSPNGCYGAHFWMNAGDGPNGENRRWPNAPDDVYNPSGFEGQYVFIIPSYKLVIARLGFTPDRTAFDEDTFLAGIVSAFEQP